MARYPVNLPSELKKEAESLAKEQGISLNQFILWSVAEKVGTLRQSLDDPNFPSITYRRGAAGVPTPILRGTGIRVQTIVGASHNWGLSPSEIASDYELAENRVREALAFYNAHQIEIDAVKSAEEAIESGDA